VGNRQIGGGEIERPSPQPSPIRSPTWEREEEEDSTAPRRRGGAPFVVTCFVRLWGLDVVDAFFLWLIERLGVEVFAFVSGFFHFFGWDAVLVCPWVVGDAGDLVAEVLVECVEVSGEGDDGAAGLVEVDGEEAVCYLGDRVGEGGADLGFWCADGCVGSGGESHVAVAVGGGAGVVECALVGEGVLCGCDGGERCDECGCLLEHGGSSLGRLWVQCAGRGWGMQGIFRGVVVRKSPRVWEIACWDTGSFYFVLGFPSFTIVYRSVSKW